MTHGGMRDYHSLLWLHYAYLQLGRYAKAAESLAVIRSMPSTRPDKQPEERRARRRIPPDRHERARRTGAA